MPEPRAAAHARLRMEAQELFKTREGTDEGARRLELAGQLWRVMYKGERRLAQRLYEEKDRAARQREREVDLMEQLQAQAQELKMGY